MVFRETVKQKNIKHFTEGPEISIVLIFKSVLVGALSGPSVRTGVLPVSNQELGNSLSLKLCKKCLMADDTGMSSR